MFLPRHPPAARYLKLPNRHNHTNEPRGLRRARIRPFVHRATLDDVVAWIQVDDLAAVELEAQVARGDGYDV